MKGRVAHAKYLFHVAIQTEQYHYTLIEQSTLVKMAFTNTPQLYS